MRADLLILFLAGVAALVGLTCAFGPQRWPGWPLRLRSPAARADALLRQIIGAEEYRHLVRRGYLDVPSPTIAGRIYRIPYYPGRVEVIERGGLVARLCVVPTGWVPDADLVLTHKLLIEGDEARYLRVANHFPPGGARRIGRWYP